MTKDNCEGNFPTEDLSDEIEEREDDQFPQRSEQKTCENESIPQANKALSMMVPWLRDEEGTLISFERPMRQSMRPNSPRAISLRGPLRRKKHLPTQMFQTERSSKTQNDDPSGNKESPSEREHRDPKTPGVSRRSPPGSAAGAGASRRSAPPPPGRPKHIPRFVGVARKVNWPVFTMIVTFFFDRKRWPAFSALPQAFQNFCCGARVGASDVDELPGFAPEWMFHIREMDDRLFWRCVEQFFVKKRFPSWKKIPTEYTSWLRTLNVREFDYPPSKTSDLLPDSVRNSLHVYIDRRLMLTKKEGPRNRKRFPLTEDLIRGVMQSLKFK